MRSTFSASLIAAMFLAVTSFLPTTCRVSAADFTVEKQDDGVTVRRDGQLVTRYLLKSGAKPILWPVIGPTGEEITRAYPMREGSPDEKIDHIHQRSFWFTHGNVNGLDFWAETGKGPFGQIIHREFTKVQGGPTAVIATKNDWVDPDQKILLKDERIVTFGVDAPSRWIDFDIRLVAVEPVKFGDTKEGSFGLRLAGTLDVEQKEGRTESRGGRIVNSEGQTDKEAWGKRAPWVDYHGPLKGKTVGVTIMNHPSSFRFPTYWHVREYGLFAANPFGVRDFTGLNSSDGSHSLKPGESIQMRYRVLLHLGDEKQGGVAKHYDEYAKPAK